MGSAVKSLVGPAIGMATGNPMLGTAIGSAISSSGARKSAAQAQQTAREQAELAYQRSLPISVSGMFGDVGFDEATRTMDIGMSPELQAEYDVALADPARQRGFIAGLEADPMAAAETFYQQQRQLYAPQQEADRIALENRLLAQGMLGSTGGEGQMAALRSAQYMQDLQARQGARQEAQQLIDTYRARAAQGLAQAEAIGGLPAKYAALSRGVGSDLGTSAAETAKTITGAAQAGAQTASSMALGQMGMFSNLVNPKNSSGGWNPFASNKLYGGEAMSAADMGGFTGYNFGGQ